jgi:hypothetical protein
MAEKFFHRGVLLPRLIVFGGLGGALAGNVGWVIWLFVEAVREDWREAITPPLIGVLVFRQKLSIIIFRRVAQSAHPLMQQPKPFDAHGFTAHLES